MITFFLKNSTTDKKFRNKIMSSDKQQTKLIPEKYTNKKKHVKAFFANKSRTWPRPNSRS